jgi:hypothetical protein
VETAISGSCGPTFSPTPTYALGEHHASPTRLAAADLSPLACNPGGSPLDGHDSPKDDFFPRTLRQTRAKALMKACDDLQSSWRTEGFPVGGLRLGRHCTTIRHPAVQMNATGIASPRPPKNLRAIRKDVFVPAFMSSGTNGSKC